MLQDTNGLESVMSLDNILCLCNMWDSLGEFFRMWLQNIKTFKTTVTAEIILHVWLQEPVQVYSTHASVSQTVKKSVQWRSVEGRFPHLQSQKIDPLRWAPKINDPNLVSEQISNSFRANPFGPVELRPRKSQDNSNHASFSGDLTCVENSLRYFANVFFLY